MLLCRTGSQTSWTQVLGSPDPSTRPECKDTHRGHLQDHLGGRRSPPQILAGEHPNWEGLTFLLRCNCTNPICTKEEGFPQTMRWLQSAEPSYNTWQVPPTIHQWATWQNKGRKIVYKVGPKKWVQPNKDSSRRRVEDSLPYQARTLRVYSDAIWPDQCSCVISKNDGYNLQKHGRIHLVPRRYSHLRWQYRSWTSSHSWEGATVRLRTWTSSPPP